METIKEQLEDIFGEPSLCKRCNKDHRKEAPSQNCLQKQIDQLQAENKKYVECLTMILRRDCYSAINNPYCDGGDCDCVWERVCQTIDPKRWKEVQALKGE